MSARDREFSRVERVAATIKRVLAAPVSDIARQHAGTMATVTRVDVAPDLRRATVSVSLFGNDEACAALFDAITTQSPELQSQLGAELRTKRTPVLRFVLDHSVAEGDRVSQLIAGQASADVPRDEH